MKLTELKNIKEAVMKDRHLELQDEIMDHFNCTDEQAEEIAHYMTDNISEYEFEDKYPEAYKIVFDKVVEDEGVRADHDTMFRYMEKNFGKLV